MQAGQLHLVQVGVSDAAGPVPSALGTAEDLVAAAVGDTAELPDVAAVAADLGWSATPRL